MWSFACVAGLMLYLVAVIANLFFPDNMLYLSWGAKYLFAPLVGIIWSASYYLVSRNKWWLESTLVSKIIIRSVILFVFSSLVSFEISETIVKVFATKNRSIHATVTDVYSTYSRLGSCREKARFKFVGGDIYSLCIGPTNVGARLSGKLNIGDNVQLAVRQNWFGAIVDNVIVGAE